ncbi:MAG TPA: alpha/beta fold hydrolase [Longimicrobiaceae bacterium]|nr:alpha/beta fold hydrolase [Longimicrobiaceae bacterium]
MATKIRIVQTTRSETRVQGGRRVVLDFREEGGDSVPAILLLPDAAEPAPGVLLLHGYSSRKEHMADNVGRALLEEGVASLAVDLPLHGDRSDPLQAQSARNPLAVVRLWRTALKEAGLAVRYLGARKEVDAARLGVAGYSLGSFLAVGMAAGEPKVRAVVLAAGGDLPAGTPLATVARTVADPLRAVRKLAPRPLLMVHGRDDRTVRPDQAERLFAAAGEPKELRWYPAGHYLPPAAIHYAAEWLREKL